jgi:uncharacterized cupin superfamily protein
MTTPRRHPHVANVNEVTPVASERGARFASVRRQLGAAAGGAGIGCSHMELPPGKTAWPFHHHCANEEALFVLEGRGRLRLGDREVELVPGDYVALPPGPSAPHQLRNEGSAPLRYLAISTMLPVDITVYPDSGKIGLFGGAAPGASKEARYLGGYFRAGEAVDYFDGEET